MPTPIETIRLGKCPGSYSPVERYNIGTFVSNPVPGTPLSRVFECKGGKCASEDHLPPDPMNSMMSGWILIGICTTRNVRLMYDVRMLRILCHFHLNPFCRTIESLLKGTVPSQPFDISANNIPFSHRPWRSIISSAQKKKLLWLAVVTYGCGNYNCCLEKRRPRHIIMIACYNTTSVMKS